MLMQVLGHLWCVEAESVLLLQQIGDKVIC